MTTVHNWLECAQFKCTKHYVYGIVVVCIYYFIYQISSKKYVKISYIKIYPSVKYLK